MFEGNRDSKSISKQLLPVPVEASYVRIYPRQYDGWICMRVELYGRGKHCPRRGYVVYRISSNNSRGDYFYFRTKRGRLFEGRRLFQIFLTGGRALNILFIIPSNKGKCEIHEYYHRKNCKKTRCFCNHSVVNN